MPAGDLVIVGTGGTSVDILEAVLARRLAGDQSLQPVCFLDDDPSRIGKLLFGLPIRGPLEIARDMPDCAFVNGIGSPASFWHRREIVARLGVAPERFSTVVHPTASVSRSATLGAGTAILQHVSISANARIGSHVVVLANSVIGHDSSVGDYTCIAAGVCLSGGVHVEELCYLGSNCTVIGGTRICSPALTGMGSVILHDVPSNSVVAGNPARFLRQVDAKLES